MQGSFQTLIHSFNECLLRTNHPLDFFGRYKISNRLGVDIRPSHLGNAPDIVIVSMAAVDLDERDDALFSQSLIKFDFGIKLSRVVGIILGLMDPCCGVVPFWLRGFHFVSYQHHYLYCPVFRSPSPSIQA